MKDIKFSCFVRAPPWDNPSESQCSYGLHQGTTIVRCNLDPFITTSLLLPSKRCWVSSNLGSCPLLIHNLWLKMVSGSTLWPSYSCSSWSFPWRSPWQDPLEWVLWWGLNYLACVPLWDPVWGSSGRVNFGSDNKPSYQLSIVRKKLSTISDVLYVNKEKNDILSKVTTQPPWTKLMLHIQSWSN